MVAKKVSTMDILFHRKPDEAEEAMKGQNKESFSKYSCSTSGIIDFD